VGIPSGVMKNTYSGNLPNGEQWQFGIWFQGNLPTSNAAAAVASDLEMTNEAGSGTSSVWNVLKAFVPPSISLTSVRVDSYNSGGPSVAFSGQSTHAAVPGTASTTQLLPNQVALCLSLISNTAGKSGRGRIYLPVSVVSGIYSLNNGLFVSAGLTSLLTALRQKFQDYAAAGQVAVVVSRLHTIAHPVAVVRADTRPDIQRRRANRMTGLSSVSLTV
jgi:hypothetical protein